MKEKGEEVKKEEVRNTESECVSEIFYVAGGYVSVGLVNILWGPVS